MSELTKRELYAGLAMQGLIVALMPKAGFEEAAKRLHKNPETVIAETAFVLADAMLKESKRWGDE